jgi:hypothetical protein
MLQRMLPPDVTARIRDYIAAQTALRTNTLLQEARAEENAINARMGVRNGNTIRAYQRLGSDEIRVRVAIIRGAIERSHAAMVGRVDHDTLGDLNAVLAEYVSAHAAELVAALTARAEKLQFSPAQTTLINVQVQNVAAAARRQAEVELAFYVDRLKSQAARASAGTTMTFNGPVGAVMTGPGSVANVAMAGEESARLVAALEALQKAIAASGDTTQEQRSEASEVASNAIVAARAEKPNRTMIGGLLSGLAVTVQTVASLQDAWQVVKDAAIAARVWIDNFGS